MLNPAHLLYLSIKFYWNMAAWFLNAEPMLLSAEPGSYSRSHVAQKLLENVC